MKHQYICQIHYTVKKAISAAKCDVDLQLICVLNEESLEYEAAI